MSSPGIAALLSFLLPGLGQIYNGQIITGIIMMILAVIFVILSAILIGIPPLLVLWILSMSDAYHTAERKQVR